MKKAPLFFAASALALGLGAAAHAQEAKDAYTDFEQMEYVPYTASDSNPFAADVGQS